MRQGHCQDCLWRREVPGASDDAAPVYQWCANRTSVWHGHPVAEAHGCPRQEPRRLPPLQQDRSPLLSFRI